MMGRHNQDQGQLFYSFNLEDAIPQDHQVRGIAAVRTHLDRQTCRQCLVADTRMLSAREPV